MASEREEGKRSGGGVGVVVTAGGEAKREKLAAPTRQQQQEEEEGRGEGAPVVVDGTEITELVGNQEAFSCYVDHKFQELGPAVADIGAALVLPVQGSSPDSDRIYSEVFNEFTHGKQLKVSKTEFKEVFSVILSGMAAGLKRDPIVILRIDGEDLEEFVNSPSFESEVVVMFSQMESANAPVHKCITMVLEQLTVDHGMPPSSDSWVSDNIVKPALEPIQTQELDKAISQEVFLEVFKKVMENINQRLKEHPVIVAHSENTFDGSDIKKLLSNKFELDKLLDTAWRDIPKDHNHKASKEYLRVALDGLAPSAGLPPYGAVEQVDAIVIEVCRVMNADDGKLVHEEEFKKLMREILGSIMLQLEVKPIHVSLNSVVHEPLAPPSTLLPPSASPTQSHSE